MTDGIIHEVIGRFVGRHKYKRFSWEIDDANMFDLEKELAEAIRQKRVWQWNAVSLKDLLGDNE